MSQLTLAELPGYTPSVPASTKARSSDPATAKLAAREAFPRAGNQRHRILVAIARSQTGLTYDDVVDRTGIIGVSVSTRITELARAGWIAEHGERKTSAGGTATVWVPSQKAIAALREAP